MILKYVRVCLSTCLYNTWINKPIIIKKINYCNTNRIRQRNAHKATLTRNSPSRSVVVITAMKLYPEPFILIFIDRNHPVVLSADCVWNAMAHAKKPDFVFRRNRRVNLNRQGHQFSRLLAADVCSSVVVMLVMMDTTCSEVVWRVLATHSNRQFPLHFPSRASLCAIIF